MGIVICARCGENEPTIGVLCPECSRELCTVPVAPEQIRSTVEHPVDAGVIDMWGRAHRLDASTLIGRDLDGPGLSIIEGLVSRHHARLSLSHGQWALRDLGSSNGTFLNDQLVVGSRPVSDRDVVTIGHVGFVFVLDAAQLPQEVAHGAIGETFRPEDRYPAELARRAEGPARRGPRPRTLPGPSEGDDDLPVADIQLIEPTGGGGGVLEFDGKQLQLSPTQFELLSVLLARTRQERHQPAPVRGFVRSSELIADLSWDTAHPGDNHVKQLVRRVRRALERAGMMDLLESRHRFGYRLRVVPREDGPR